MEQELVRLLVGGLAVVAGDVDVDVGREQTPPFSWATLCTMRSAMTTALAAGALGDRDAKRPAARTKPFAARGQGGHARFGGRRWRATTLGDVADIDGAAVAGGDEQVADLVGSPAASAPATSGDLPSAVADLSGLERPVGAFDLGGELLQRDAVERASVSGRARPGSARAARRRCRSGRHRPAWRPRRAARGRRGSGRWRPSERRPPASA